MWDAVRFGFARQLLYKTSSPHQRQQVPPVPLTSALCGTWYSRAGCSWNWKELELGLNKYPMKSKGGIQKILPPSSPLSWQESQEICFQAARWRCLQKATLEQNVCLPGSSMSSPHSTVMGALAQCRGSCWEMLRGRKSTPCFRSLLGLLGTLTTSRSLLGDSLTPSEHSELVCNAFGP